MIRKLVVPPLQGSDVLLNLTQGFTLGYSLPPLQGSGGLASGSQGRTAVRPKAFVDSRVIGRTSVRFYAENLFKSD